MSEPLSTPRWNNFDAIRLLAALAVVVGHAWPLTGTSHPPEIGGLKVYTLAVYVFFSVSGYLITQSWLRSGSVRSYLANRVLRIFPALIGVVLVTVLLLGPLFSTLGAAGYFASPVTWQYLANLSLVGVYDLPGVFRDHPITAVNGPLWSLGPEFLCYLAVLALGLVVLRRPVLRAVLFIAAALALTLLVDSPLEDAFRSMVFFGVGSLLASLRLPSWPALVVLPAWLIGAWLAPDLALPLAWITVPYLVVTLGTRSTPVLRRFGRFGDISYGLYLWGFPVQQSVIAVVGTLPLALDLLVVVPLTAVIAFASWHLVEKRALAQKSRFATPSDRLLQDR